MAETRSHVVSYRRASLAEMPVPDQELVKRASEAAAMAYAPYSNFRVGAALRLKDGAIIAGNNQENASFPAGICAERTALHAAMSNHPVGVVDSIAVVVPQVKGDMPISPCGICRQALLEQETRQGSPMRVLLGTSEGTVIELAAAADLLPLHFDRSQLER